MSACHTNDIYFLFLKNHQEASHSDAINVHYKMIYFYQWIDQALRFLEITKEYYMRDRLRSLIYFHFNFYLCVSFLFCVYGNKLFALFQDVETIVVVTNLSVNFC